MKVNEKTEKIRVIKAFKYITEKLKFDVVLIIEPMTPRRLKIYETSHFTIERSNRSTQDKSTFLVHFNQNVISKLSLLQIKRHAFHEILHTMTWPYIDEYFAVIKHISDIALYNELARRSEDTRENVTYMLERKLGPFVLPQCDWSIEE
jgi:hypothetical protein